MARISESELERLKKEVSVERLVTSSGIALKKSGKDWLGCCPFHEDATASLVVTPGKNLWHCFGCGIGGGPIDWVIKKNGVSFRHAVELLREGLSASSLAAEPVASAVPVKRSTIRALPAPVALDADDHTLLEQVIDYYTATLKQSPEALAYLQARGLIHPELIDIFRLGYANRTLGLRLPTKTRVAGADIRTRLQKIGIYRESGHEHFNGSLVVPIMDAAGNVVEVYGRKLRDDLREGTPKHLYLPGPHAGVFNREVLVPGACEEIIVCEALIDAMTFWCAGYRNVTSSYGIEGITDELIKTIQEAGAKRILIAFDRDEAGERGAQKLAGHVLALGLDCYRIRFPKGMDANEYALKVTPAAKSLGLLIRKAEWMGQGQAPRREATEPVIPSFSLAAAPQALPVDNERTSQIEPEPLPAAVIPSAPAPDAATRVSEREIVLTFGEGRHARRWRVRGLPRNLAVGVLKVNLMVSDEDGHFHVDTLDLYAARARAMFLQQAASELGLDEAVLKTDLGRVLLKCETLQDEVIQDALIPREPAIPGMTDAERHEALDLLQSPDLMARIVTDFDLCGVVGETTNKQVAYLAAVSRLLDRPLAVVIQSSSAAGKSSLMDAVLAFVPEEARTQYSAMTGQSLFYMGQTSLKHKILAIAEEAGASRASYALKLLQSEGELTIASTGTDPSTGNLITQEYRVEGPTMLMMTTTAIDLDEELMNRCLILSVDEEREQTRRIHALQREKRTLAGMLRKQEKDTLHKTHQNAQRLLRALAVVNPYADRLTFLDDRTRTRRDHDKYLTLIDTITLLHQHQRAIKTAIMHGRSMEYIEATLSDIASANRIAHEVLGRSLDELPPQTRRVLGMIVEYVTTRAATDKKRRADMRFTRGELRAASGCGDTQLKLHLARLAELEYLLVHRAERGQGYVYELLYDGDAATPMHLSGLIDAAALQSHAYDVARSASPVPQSGSGRGEVGQRAGAYRSTELVAEEELTGLDAKPLTTDTESRTGGEVLTRRSYRHPSAGSSALAAAVA